MRRGWLLLRLLGGLGGLLRPGVSGRRGQRPAGVLGRLKAAGVPNTRENGFHALRHYFASVLLHNGVDIRALATYLGRGDPGFTLRTYVHLMPDAADRMRSAVDLVMADGPATAQAAQR